ncbi:hypothetical protein BLJAPNOD_01757 [Ensifer sp. M14]|uniref:hypothetical protein n=1 Tax=Ensifer sp. M14 TaxID=2203782 RepID=UPI000E1C9424|nr:hypothetical protein [Ensifer sp. M14]RDL50634.1 hypothetical protein BLJAPNOD_01757 [Ensifer sp. M14]
MTMAKTLNVLNDMVRDGIIETYVIAGAVAALQYIEPMVTEDLDILITFNAPVGGLVTLGAIVPYLSQRGYTEWRKEGLLVEGWPVQFLPATDALDLEALRNGVEIQDDFGTGEIITTRTLSPEHVVAMALRTGRYKDNARVLAFLSENAVDLGALKGVIARHGLEEHWQRFLTQTGHPDPFAIGFKP